MSNWELDVYYSKNAVLTQIMLGVKHVVILSGKKISAT